MSVFQVFKIVQKVPNSGTHLIYCTALKTFQSVVKQNKEIKERKG